MEQQQASFEQSINLVNKHIKLIHRFSFSCKRWMPTEIIRLELSKNIDFTRTWSRIPWAKKDKNETSLFWAWRVISMFWVDLNLEWYESAMVFRVFIFIFCLETALRESNWMRKNSVAVMVIFFRKCHSGNTKFFVEDYETPWKRHLKDTLQLKIFRTWINKGVEPALHKTLHQDI